MRSRRNPEHIIQFFQSALLRLRKPEEDHPEGYDIHSRVEAECSRDTKGAELTREGDGDYGGPEVVCGYRPRHADFSVTKGEDFCRISKRDRPFTWTIESIVNIDEEGDHAEMGAATRRNEVAHPCSEERPRHIWESKEKQSTTAKCIDGPDGWPGKDEIDETEAKGSKEGSLKRGS